MKRRTAFTLIELLSVIVLISVLAAIAVPNFLEAQIRSKVAGTKSDMAVLDAALRGYYVDYRAYPPNEAERRRFLRRCVDLQLVDEISLPTPADATVPWVSAGNGRLPNSSPGATLKLLSLGLNESGLPGMDMMAAEVTSATLTASAPPVPAGLRHWSMMGYYAIMDYSGNDLWPLTTPVAYFTWALPADSFNDAENGPFYYANCLALHEMLAAEGKPAPDDPPIASDRYILLSYGPTKNGVFNAPVMDNPVKGPFYEYDPTNGTISTGYLVRLGD